MPERAHVTSLEALESFRANLILYVSKARPTLEEVSADVVRTRLWLQNDQRTHWENQVRRRAKALEQAQEALSSARMSHLREASAAEQMAVHRAKRALEEAEAKLKQLKQWNREFDSRVEPLVKQLEKLHTVLANDMLLAGAFLAQAINTLAAYADIAPPSTAPSPAQPSSQNPTEGGLSGDLPHPGSTAVELGNTANAILFPLPARDERGEGRGEGHSRKNDPPLPNPLLPRREEREKIEGGTKRDDS